jgi:hypothetical protein
MQLHGAFIFFDPQYHPIEPTYPAKKSMQDIVCVAPMGSYKHRLRFFYLAQERYHCCTEIHYYLSAAR